MGAMSPKLEKAAKAFRRAEAQVEKARAELAAAILEALDDPKISQTDIARVTGYTRETIRRMQIKARADS